MNRDELTNLPPITQAFGDAQTQLQAYRRALEHKYGDALKLRTHTVVAIGTERLLWQS